MKQTTASLAASDPQAVQRNALALVQSLVPAAKAPGKPFVHLAARGIGSCAFVSPSLDAARAALSAFAEAGYSVTFALWIDGRSHTPLHVQSSAV